METPETRYAKTADGVHIAYQVVGHGRVDLVLWPATRSCPTNEAARTLVGHHERVGSRMMVLAAVWMGLVLPACEEDLPETAPSTETSSTTPSEANEPEGFDVEQVPGLVAR